MRAVLGDISAGDIHVIVIPIDLHHVPGMRIRPIARLGLVRIEHAADVSRRNAGFFHQILISFGIPRADRPPIQEKADHALITPSLKTKSFTNLLFLTVGLGLLLTNGALVIFGSTYYKIITPYSQTYIPLGPVTIALPRLVSFLILIVVAIALFAFLKYSTTGKQIRAVSQNPIGAEVVGINVKKIYILTYGLGVALAGIAGSLLTQFYTIYPTAGASFGFRALIVVVVGGLGSIPGAFFAGIFLGLLEQMSALFISPSYSDMIVFVTFIIILVVRQVMILRRR